MSTVSFSSLKLFNVNALLTFHNIHINFKPGRIITNNPFLFPTHERWIPLLCWRRQANCIFLLNHCRVFFYRERWIPLSLVQPHTHSENCVRTNIITYNRFFLNISPEKHVTQKNQNYSIPRLSNTKFWKKTFPKNSRQQGWFFDPVKNIGGAHPSRPICSLRHRFKKVMGPYVQNSYEALGSKNLWGLRFTKFMGTLGSKKLWGLRFTKLMGP